MAKFYDHAEGEYILGRDLVYTYYTDEKTGYTLDFWHYKEDNTKFEKAKDMNEDAEEKAGVPAETYLLDFWYCAAELIEKGEEYDKDWVSVLKSVRIAVNDGEEQRIGAVHDQVILPEREIDGEGYKIWAKNLPVAQLDE